MTSLPFLTSPPLARRGAVIWAVLLFTLTSWPSPPAVPVLSTIPNFDKLIHFTLYGVEALFLYASIRWPGRAGFSFARALVLVGAMAVWGIADETHQAWIPGRSMEAGDVAADVTGAAFGAMIASLADRGRTASRTVPPIRG